MAHYFILMISGMLMIVSFSLSLMGQALNGRIKKLAMGFYIWSRTYDSIIFGTTDLQ